MGKGHNEEILPHKERFPSESKGQSQWPSSKYPRISPYRTTPLRDSIAEGVLRPLFLRFMWYHTSIAEVPPCTGGVQKNPRVRKMFVRNSGAGNGCVNFMDALEKCVLSAGKKTHVHKIPRLRGVFWVLGGGSADFIFMGARIF